MDVHVVHGHTNRLQNAIRLVKGLQIEVDEIVFNGLASSLALLSGEQKELGALVIDIGGGTTDYVVYSDGVIKHTGVLAVGGDHVSNDLGHGLKVPLSRAEKLKLEHGSALVDEETYSTKLDTVEGKRVMQYWVDWANKLKLGGPQYTATRTEFLAGKPIRVIGG